MQGGQEVGRESVSDLAEEPGEGSPHQTARGQSGDGLERRRICCDGPVVLPDTNANSSRLDEGLPTSCPHPGELSGGWGEFEGFRESSADHLQEHDLALPRAVSWGVDAAQKSPPGGQGHVLEGSDLRKPEELLAVSGFHLHHCKALIQTKLSGTSSSRQGSLITYSLFLKTPLQGNGRYITIPQKKIFTPRNLKMAFFNNDVC